MASYSEQLNRDPAWALREGSRFFYGESGVNRALRQIATRLEELEIPYAVAGGMAVFHHGLHRFTEDVDLLVRSEDIGTIHARLEGRGYLPKFRGSKNLRDTEVGVSIEFLLTGEYPGDGRVKPVAFPDPAEVSTVASGIRFLNLETLIELKIASGISKADRLKDLADVQQLIAILKLDRSFGESLNTYVHPKFDELWESVQGSSNEDSEEMPR